MPFQSDGGSAASSCSFAFWPILLPTLNSSLKLDPLVDSAVDLNPSISQDITDSLSCYLDMGDEGVGLLDQDDFWCRTRVD
jgi:hypothetical protein